MAIALLSVVRCARSGPRLGPGAALGARPGSGSSAVARPGTGPGARPRARTAAGTTATTAAASTVLLVDLQPPAVQLQVVTVRQGVLQAASRGELHDALAGPRRVGVGVRDFTRRTEVVFQILKRKKKSSINFYVVSNSSSNKIEANCRVTFSKIISLNNYNTLF